MRCLDSALCKQTFQRCRRSSAMPPTMPTRSGEPSSHGVLGTIPPHGRTCAKPCSCATITHASAQASFAPQRRRPRIVPSRTIGPRIEEIRSSFGTSTISRPYRSGCTIRKSSGKSKQSRTANGFDRHASAHCLSGAGHRRRADHLHARHRPHPIESRGKSSKGMPPAGRAQPRRDLGRGKDRACRQAAASLDLWRFRQRGLTGRLADRRLESTRKFSLKQP